MLIKLLKKIRHSKHSKVISPVFILLGKFYRYITSKTGKNRFSLNKIGEYGPYKMDLEFTFSDFESWGGAHNCGFDSCIKLLHNKECFIDVGAHIGLVSIPASTVMSKTGVIYAFEPSLVNRQHLISHIKKNNILNINVLPTLVGSKNSKSLLFYEKDSASGQNGIYVKKHHNQYHTLRVDQIQLDFFCDNRKLKPEVIKIDVEGAECGVLQGALLTISKYKPVIFLSVHPEELKLFDKSVEILKDIVASMDYKIINVDGSTPDELVLSEYILIHKHSNNMPPYNK